MTDGGQHVPLPALAGALQGTFPACDDAPLALALLRLLAGGEPVDVVALARATGSDEKTGRTQVQLVVSPGGVDRAGADATAAWQREHPDGSALDLDGALELGQRAVAPLLGGDAGLCCATEVTG